MTYSAFGLLKEFPLPPPNFNILAHSLEINNSPLRNVEIKFDSHKEPTY